MFDGILDEGMNTMSARHSWVGLSTHQQLKDGPHEL